MQLYFLTRASKSCWRAFLNNRSLYNPSRLCIWSHFCWFHCYVIFNTQRYSSFRSLLYSLQGEILYQVLIALWSIIKKNLVYEGSTRASPSSESGFWQNHISHACRRQILVSIWIQVWFVASRHQAITWACAVKSSRVPRHSLKYSPTEIHQLKFDVNI